MECMAPKGSLGVITEVHPEFFFLSPPPRHTANSHASPPTEKVLQHPSLSSHSQMIFGAFGAVGLFGAFGAVGACGAFGA